MIFGTTPGLKGKSRKRRSSTMIDMNAMSPGTRARLQVLYEEFYVPADDRPLGFTVKDHLELVRFFRYPDTPLAKISQDAGLHPAYVQALLAALDEVDDQ
jgi:hypothetical protein